MEGKFEMASKSVFQKKKPHYAIQSSVGAQNASMNKPFHTQDDVSNCAIHVSILTKSQSPTAKLGQVGSIWKSHKIIVLIRFLIQLTMKSLFFNTILFHLFFMMKTSSEGKLR
jgi:hypothetical protein